MAVEMRTARRTLPAPMLDRSSYSILSVIKQAIGKDLTRFSIPVVWNEPLSFLQRLAETLEYSSLIDQAALAASPVERLHLLTAFVISNLATHLERMSKPFNPLLGETYELQMHGDAPFTFVAEQVSHHPPVSALFARGEHWTLWGNIEPRVKFQGTNVVAVSEGRWVLRIQRGSRLSRAGSHSSFQSCNDQEEESAHVSADDDDEEYVWHTPTVVVHNIVFGRLWCEFQGPIDLKHTQSNRRSVITIKSHSWFGSQSSKAADMFKYTGFIFDGKAKIGAFHGNYGHCYYALDHINETPSKSSPRCSAGGHNCIYLNASASVATPCDLLVTPSSRLIWHRSLSSMNSHELALRPQYYYFTAFAMCLNELTSSPFDLPATDSRYRQDVRLLEKGETDAASQEKHRLEEKQRADAHDRQEDFRPMWFKKDSHGEYLYTGQYEQRKFDQCPSLFSQASFL